MPSSRKISRSSKPSAQSLKATPSARRTLIPKPPSLTPLGSARVSADGPDTMENRDLWSCSKDGSTSTPQNTAPLSPTQSHLCESDSPQGVRAFLRRAIQPPSQVGRVFLRRSIPPPPLRGRSATRQRRRVRGLTLRDASLILDGPDG